VLEIRQNLEGKTVILRLAGSWLYFRAFVAQFEADMKRLGFNSVLGGLAVLFAIQPNLRAETNDLPHFQEIFRLLRAHLPNASEEDLNRAAVQGLLTQFYPRVILVTNDSPASAPADAPLVSQATVYDKSYGYVRVARVAAGLAEHLKSAYAKLNATNKLKGLVLDLRFADGHDFTAAANAADRFLSKEQPLLSWEEDSAHSTAKTDAIDVPVSVLINRETVGAAEALAAVLREMDGSVLIGARTAGQAHVFKEFNLANGQRLRIATGQVQVGTGKSLSAGGVAPDIEVAVKSDDEKAYFADAFKLLSKPIAQLKATNNPVQIGSTNRDRRRLNEAELVRIQREGRTTNEDDLTAAEPPPEDGSEPLVRDPALARALDLLKGIAIVKRALQR
jgi:Peptidase family S41